jgi:hypothetical protein
LLAAGSEGSLNRKFTATGTESQRRDAYLYSFMYDQGLVTLGTKENTLVFPNQVARLLVDARPSCRGAS